MGRVSVYGIGNPLIDVLAEVSDAEINTLGLNKGTMQLIDDEAGEHILDHLGDREMVYESGGSCPNTINTLAALGVSAALSGCVGTDRLGGIYADRLEADGVVSDVAPVAGPTGTSIVLVTPDAERTMSTRLGVCRRYAPHNVDHRLVAEAEVLYFTGYMWDTEPQKAAVAAAIQTARHADTTVVFDVADPMAVGRFREEFRELIRGDVDVMLANREEASMLLENDDVTAMDAARELSQWCSLVAVKDGTNGSIVATGEEQFSIPVVPVDTDAADAASAALDTTGAGDTYAAGLLFGLLRGDSPERAGQLASLLASQVVQRRGAQFHGAARDRLPGVVETATAAQPVA